jgi:hypothetical protein
MVKYTLEQWIFLYDSSVKKKFYKSCKRMFIHNYPGVHVPSPSTIGKLVKTVHSPGSSLDKIYTTQNVVLRPYKTKEV